MNWPLPKWNIAVVDPTVDDDRLAGYSPLSEWLNTDTGAVFKLIDDTPGAAVWKEITFV